MADTYTTKTFDPNEQSAHFHDLIKYAIAPRPICLASTIDASGHVNLSPFSYFNLFSHQPPICIFSPLRRMRDGSTKHTLENMKEVAEVVINVVNQAIVHQQSLASTEYGKGVDEFEKSGLTPVASERIQPPRVAESPVQLECRVREIIALGDEPGAGQLVVAEILAMHIHARQLDADFRVRQDKLDLVARLGGDWYCRVTADSLFEVAKPLRNLGIGIDQLPASIRESTVLTGNQLAQLANVEQIPALDHDFQRTQDVLIAAKDMLSMHRDAAQHIDAGRLHEAWQILLQSEQ